MDDGEEFLRHYASKYYDPAKAREYYLRTRELKGRQSTKGMSDTQKEAWSYSRNAIGNAKKAELTNAAKAQKVKLEQLRKQSEETRKRITLKLENFIKSLAVKEVEAEEVEIPELFEIPKSASPAKKALFEKQNQRKLERYRNELADAKSKAQSINNAARQAAGEKANAAREKANAEIKKVGSDLKSAITKARSDYDHSKKETTAKYKAAVDSEYNNIRTKLPSAPKKPKGSKRKAVKS